MALTRIDVRFDWIVAFTRVREAFGIMPALKCRDTINQFEFWKFKTRWPATRCHVTRWFELHIWIVPVGYRPILPTRDTKSTSIYRPVYQMQIDISARISNIYRYFGPYIKYISIHRPVYRIYIDTSSFISNTYRYLVIYIKHISISRHLYQTHIDIPTYRLNIDHL